MFSRFSLGAEEVLPEHTDPPSVESPCSVSDLEGNGVPRSGPLRWESRAGSVDERTGAFMRKRILSSDEPERALALMRCATGGGVGLVKPRPPKVIVDRRL